MNIRRVLMTADTVGGVWSYALELSRALGPHGIEVGLATMGAPLSPPQAHEAAALPHLKIFESAYRLEWMTDPWADVERAAAWLLTVENEFGPDVVHLNGYAHGHLPWHAPHLVVGHSCVLSWWRAVKNEDAPRQWSRYRQEVARGLAGADRVAAPSRYMLAELERYYGPFPSSAVIPNGRDAAQYRVAEKEPFVFAAGRIWDEAKNLQVLGRLADILDWPVFVAGETRDPEGDERSLNNVRLLGFLDSGELAGWLSRAAIYCLPARYEPFGLSVLEAALSGCALVLGEIPSLRENWEGAAAFVPPEDERALGFELQELIANAPRRNALAAAAYTRALDLTPARMAAGYLDLYAGMVAQRQPTSTEKA
jgi:glycogen(starch) synthase